MCEHVVYISGVKITSHQLTDFNAVKNCITSLLIVTIFSDILCIPLNPSVDLGLFLIETFFIVGRFQFDLMIGSQCEINEH